MDPPRAQSPVLAIAASPDGLWAAGPGGLACLGGEGRWHVTRPASAHLLVSALAYTGNELLVGGAEVLAVRHRDGRWTTGVSNEPLSTVTAVATGPEVGLAATLSAGMFRSSGDLRSWQSSSFGLRADEVTAVALHPEGRAIAGTPEGLYRSPNAGRAWRACAQEHTAIGVAATSFTPSGDAVAITNDGTVLASGPGLDDWRERSRLAGWETSAIVALAGDNLMVAGPGGIVRSADGGRTWTASADEGALCLDAAGDRVYAGTDTGILVTENGSWRHFGSPPLADFRWLRRAGEITFIAGPSSGLFRYERAWAQVETPPGLLTAFATAPGGPLLVSTNEGLAWSADLGSSWTPASGAEGCAIAQLVVDSSGVGFSTTADGRHLLITMDAGRSWRELDFPFGSQEVVALEADGSTLHALTVDAGQGGLRTWRSTDRGLHWSPSGRPLADPRRPAQLPAARQLHRLATGYGAPADRVVDAHHDGNQLWVLLAGGEILCAAIE